MSEQARRLSCFKAYDVRGRVGEELDEALVRRIGRAYARFLGPKRVAVGYDIRLSSPDLARALGDGLIDSGVDGYLVAAGDVDTLTKRICELARQKDLASRIGTEARTRWTNRFNIKGVANQYAAVIERAAGRVRA